MAKKPIHPTCAHIIHYYVHMYYMILDKNDTIRSNPVSHYLLVEQVYSDYVSELERRYPEWDNEETRQYFKDNINWLTNVYTNYEAHLQLEKDRAAFLELVDKSREEMRDFVHSEFKRFSGGNEKITTEPEQDEDSSEDSEDKINTEEQKQEIEVEPEQLTITRYNIFKKYGG